MTGVGLDLVPWKNFTLADEFYVEVLCYFETKSWQLYLHCTTSGVSSVYARLGIDMAWSLMFLPSEHRHQELIVDAETQWQGLLLASSVILTHLRNSTTSFSFEIRILTLWIWFLYKNALRICNTPPCSSPSRVPSFINMLSSFITFDLDPVLISKLYFLITEARMYCTFKFISIPVV